MCPRNPRSDLEAYTYFHVCARGNAKQRIFVEDEDRLRYLQMLERYRSRFLIEFFAYCLMSNHIHFLLKAHSIDRLSRYIHGLHSAYAMYFNLKYNRRGHLFEGRFRSWVIRDEGHFFLTKEYIENNPVKAGLISCGKKYPWGSVCGRRRRIITLSKVVSYIGTVPESENKTKYI